MYDNALTFVDMNKITKVLCGKTRPIHFSGVCTVVSKLFNIVQPDRAYFGQKDAQQLCVIKKMVKDLNFDIEIVGCPIIRENDGLAKSSRNTYLNADERKAALCLSRSLEIGKKMIADGETDVKTIISAIKAEIEKDIQWVYSLFPRLEERSWQLAGTLSGGEQQMLAVGRALMSRPKLMMLDEPSLGLAPLVVQDIFSIIREINRQGVTVLLVEQNANMALKIADLAYVLETGTITMSGTGAELLADSRVKEAYLGKSS